MDAHNDNTASPDNKLNETQSSSERTLLQSQQFQKQSLAAVPDQDMKSQNLSRELGAAQNKRDWSSGGHKVTQRELATAISEDDQLRFRLESYNQVTGLLGLMAGIIGVELDEVKEALVQLKTKQPRMNPLLRWFRTKKEIYWKKRAFAAETRVRTAQEKTRVVNKRNKDLTSKVPAAETDLQAAQLEIGRIQVLEEALSANEDKLANLEFELRARARTITRLRDKNVELELARTESGSAEQAVLKRLDTLLLAKLEPTGPESMLQALVDSQKINLANTQKELTEMSQSHSAAQQELRIAEANLVNSRSQFTTFKESIRIAVGCYGWAPENAELVRRVRETKSGATAATRALEDVDGVSELAKIQTLKNGCKDFNSVNVELENTRKDRDGIYNTLDVSNCLQAHLAIGDLKLSKLECEVLLKAVGKFEDEEAVREIKRLKKADLELVKVVSALDGCVGDSNVAKIDALKAACKTE
jgi:hypothetical protein